MGFRTAIVACMTFVALLVTAPATIAQANSSWDGTWIGNWEKGDGTQITFAGNEFISIYWDGDYVPDATGSLSSDGRVETIVWHSGRAVLTRVSGTAIDIVIHEKGKKDVSFALKRDG